MLKRLNPTEMNIQAEFGHGGSFYTAAAEGLFFVRRVDDLDVIGFVAGHHLIA